MRNGKHPQHKNFLKLLEEITAKTMKATEEQYGISKNGKECNDIAAGKFGASSTTKLLENQGKLRNQTKEENKQYRTSLLTCLNGAVSAIDRVARGGDSKDSGKDACLRIERLLFGAVSREDCKKIRQGLANFEDKIINTLLICEEKKLTQVKTIEKLVETCEDYMGCYKVRRGGP